MKDWVIAAIVEVIDHKTKVYRIVYSVTGHIFRFIGCILKKE